MEPEREELAPPVDIAEWRKGRTGPDIDSSLGTFIDGSPADLSPVCVQNVVAITERLGGRLPEITSNDKFAVLFYGPKGFNPMFDSVSVTMNSVTGAVVDGGFGREWWDSHPDNPIIKGLLTDFGTGVAMSLPMSIRADARKAPEESPS